MILPCFRSPACLATGLALLLGACASPAAKVQHAEVPQCIDKASAGCEAARAGFQRLNYASPAPDKLAVAAARALGDLNFEVERDDAERRAAATYIDSAPVHAKQLDELFRGTVKPYRQALITAQVEVLPLPGQDGGGEVRLRLYAAPDGGGQPAPVDSVAPYQVFFRQLGEELGLPAQPVEAGDSSKDLHKALPHAVSPSIGGL